MTQVVDQTPNEAPASTDLVAAVQQILQSSTEPLTLPKIRGQLPGSFRSVGLEALAETLRRQVTANVLCQYPKYRSKWDRFWDRPMAEHITALVRSAMQDTPLAWSELRRKLPAYVQEKSNQVLEILEQQIARGVFFRHPRSGRSGERFGLAPPDPKDYLRPELLAVFQRLEQLGFSQGQLRAGALELLHEEEWSLSQATAPAEPAATQQLTEPAVAPAQAAAAAPPVTPENAPDPTHAEMASNPEQQTGIPQRAGPKTHS